MASLVPFLKKKLQQVEQGIAHIGAAPHPVQINSPEVIQKLQNANRGVLAQGNNRNIAIAQLNNAQRQAQPTLKTGLKNVANAFNDTNAQAGRFVVQNLITRPAAEVAQSARQLVTGKASSYTPGTAMQKQIFGDTPVDSIQKKVTDQYRRDIAGTKNEGALVDTSGIRKQLAKPLAIAEAAGSIANDIPVVGAVAKGSTKAIKAVAPKAGEAIEAAGKAALPVAKQGIKVLQAEKRSAGIRQSAKETLINEANRAEKAAQQLDKKQSKYPEQSETIQKQAQQLRTKAQSLRESVVKQPLHQQITDKLLTVQPGLSLKDVSKTPKVTLPAPELPTTVPNSLTQGGIDGRQALAPEVQTAIKGEHTQRNTAQLGDKANTDISKLDDQTAIQAAHDRLNVDLGKIDDKDVAFTNEAIQRAQNAGRMEDAINLHDKLSEHLVKTGQTSQAASLLYKLNPDNIFYKAVRDLKKSGKDVTPELQTTLKQQADAIKTATGTEAKQRATAQLGKTVADNIPKGRMNDLLSIWKAGLLSGVKTQQGNAISNATFGTLKKVSDIPSAAVDKGISLFTGQRTKVATGRGIIAGGKEGAKKGINTLKTGIDERNITGTKYEQHGELNFKNPVIQKVFGDTSNLVFRGMSAADQPFYYAAAKNNLYDLALAEAKNKGLRGTEKSKFVKDFVANPPTHAAQRSKDAAEKAVLGYDTVASKIVSGAHQVIDRVAPSPAAAAVGHTVVGVLAPFVKVPSAFISRTIDFTPAGPFKEAINQISNKKFDQRALSEAIGQGMTGTGVIALGMALSQSGQLSGNYPKNDQKEAQRWKAEGITPNSVKLGKTWVSLNYLGPVGLLFNAGKQFHDAKDSTALGKVAASVGGLGQGLMGQSFLQGFSGFSDAINDPERNAKSFVNSQGSSIVPAWSNDIANVTDNFQRQADTLGQSVKNRIPGLRETNKVKQDVYGNELKQPAGKLNTLNGIKPSNSLTNTQTSIAEVNRLHSINPDDSNLQVTPTPVGKTITVDKKQLPLTTDQRYQLQKQVGQATQANWNKLIKTPEYQAMDDAAKAKKLSDIRQDSTELATRKFVTDNNLATYSKSASKGATALSNGNLTRYTSATSSAGGKQTTVSTSIDKHSQKVLNEYNTLDSDTIKKKMYNEPDYEYKVEQAKYDNAKANGTLSKAQQTGKLNDLQKAKVGSAYSKDTREIYELSKSEIYGLITSDKNGKKIADDLKAYDQALKDNGLITTSKFKYGFASATGGKTGSKGGGKFKVASLPKLSSRTLKTPKLKVAKVKLGTLKTKKAVYRSGKIASNVNAKLKAKTA